jgi:hypothetical protein
MLRAGSSGTDGVLLSQSQIGKLPSLLGLPKNRADQEPVGENDSRTRNQQLTDMPSFLSD